MDLQMWRRLSVIGSTGLDLEGQRKTRALNQFIVIAASSLASYGLMLLLLEPRLAVLGVLDLIVSLVHLTTYAHVRAGRRALAVTQFLLLCNGQLALAAHLAGPAFGFHYYYFAFAGVVPMICPKRQRYHYVWTVISTALFLHFARQPVMPGFDGAVADLFRVMTVVATCGTLWLIAFLFEVDVSNAESDLQREHARSESLLLNILPATISERLKEGEASIADGFAGVTVVFADIVGFTGLSERLAPDALVRLLNEVFSRFDELAERYGVEKIKTIGDAYMAAAGLPEPDPGHALMATRMALGMRAVVDELAATHEIDLAIRIGLHSGPVVAGVIGRKKFIYDLWGDTVNTASRMESHGVQGAVHVSAATAALIESRFVIEPRGEIMVKGKGQMTTFLVRGERSS